MYLDKKEQILDVKLTKYGEYLLSIGQFKPDSYVFLDDDVIYDSNYAGVSIEIQNDISARIKEVPQLEAQHLFHGVETEVNVINKQVRQSGEDKNTIFDKLASKNFQPSFEKHFAVSLPLGTINLESNSVAAWSVNVIKGELSGSIQYQTGSQTTTKIPLLTLKDSRFKTTSEIDFFGEEKINSSIGSLSDLNLLTKKFEDGSFINIVEDTIILEIDELNTNFENENFDIEIYKVEEETYDSITEEILIPLKFVSSKKVLIKNNILLDDDEIDKINKDIVNLEPGYVEYFFDVLIDNEIDTETLLKVSPDKTSKLYSSDVKEEDLQKC